MQQLLLHLGELLLDQMLHPNTYCYFLVLISHSKYFSELGQHTYLEITANNIKPLMFNMNQKMEP